MNDRVPARSPTVDPSRRARGLLLLVVAVTLALTVWSQAYQLCDRYRVERDVQYYYWMARYQDPDLFARDEWMGSRLVEMDLLGMRLILYPRSLGYGLLFHAASYVIDPIWLSKWMVLALMPLCVVCLYKLGLLSGDHLVAVSLCLLSCFFILASPRSTSIAGGVQRSFAVPLLIAFLYCLANGRHLWAAAMIVVSALFYLPNLPLTALAYALSLVRAKRPLKLSFDLARRKVLPLVGALVLSALVVAFAMGVEYGWFAPAAADAAAGSAEESVSMVDDPKYQAGGSTPLFILPPWFGRAGAFDMGADAFNFFVLLLLGCLFYGVLGRQSLHRVPRVVWCTLAAGVIMYAVSLFAVLRLSTMALYLPSRYTRSTLFLSAVCYVGLNWPGFVRRAPAWLRRRARLVIFAIISLILAFGAVYLLFPGRSSFLLILGSLGLAVNGLAVVFLGGGVLWLWQRPAVGRAARLAGLVSLCGAMLGLGAVYVGVLGMKPIDPTPAAREAYEFVASLPEDAVLAGDPELMTGVPLFARRSVLFTALTTRRDAPAVAYYDALYAETLDSVHAFCTAYGVRYLLIDVAVFDPDYVAAGEFFYDPYNDEIVQLVAGRSDFVVPRIEPLFENGSLRVVACGAE